MKTCSRCKLSKPESEFSPNRALKNRDGLSFQCKVCKSEITALWRKRNPERKRAADAARYQAQKQRLNQMSTERKRRARARLSVYPTDS